MYRNTSTQCCKDSAKTLHLQILTYIFAYTHPKFERLEALLRGQARCMKEAT